MKTIPLPIKLAFAWLWVALPLGWGVCQSAIKSAPLFSMDIDHENSVEHHKKLLDINTRDDGKK